MQLKHPLPPAQSLEQVLNHYLVEKSIAQRLKQSSREQRHAIYATMYDELFARVPDHPSLMQRASTPGGRYIFRTPHALTGPHDVSQYFSDDVECFHLKEWTYGEIQAMLMDLGYSGFCSRWRAKAVDLQLPNAYFVGCEKALGVISRRHARVAAKFLIPCIYGFGIK